MKRLLPLGSAIFLAALAVGVGAQETPCPEGEVRFGGSGGCGVNEPAPDTAAMVPAILAAGSDVDVNLRYTFSNGVVEGSGAVPAGAEAVLIYLDHERGIYQTIDLGGLYTDSMTQANVSRIQGWLRELDSDAPPEAVLAYLAEVESLKLDTRARMLRSRLPISNLTTEVVVEEEEPEESGEEEDTTYTFRQQRDCEQWAVMTLQTSDVIMIPMVRTKNDTTVRFRNGRRWMRILVSCWTTNPSPIFTTWHTASCWAIPQFWRTRARSTVYHAAYNDDFLGGLGGRHWVRHWIWAHFDHLRNLQGTTFDFRYSGPSGPTFMTTILGEHDESTC